MKKIFAFVAFSLLTVSMYAANITVAQALEIGKNLAAGTESDQEYTVEGYVAKSFGVYMEGQQSFYMSDDANVKAMTDFQAYECTVPKAVRAGSKVTVTGKIINSNRTLSIRIKHGTVTIITEGTGESPDQPSKPDTPTTPTQNTITVAKALEIGQALADNASTTEEYVVAGYACKTYAANEGYTDQTWYMHDTDPNAFAEFQAFRCTPDYTVQQGDYMLVKGKITKYVNNGKTTIEISKGTATHGTAPGGGSTTPETPDTPTQNTITVAKALELGQALADNASTPETYVVAGYACKTYDANPGYTDQTWYMHDTDPNAFAEFQAFRCTPDYTVKQGDYMLVTGKIMKYVNNGKTTIEISKGTAKHGTAPQGIDEIVLTEKVQKIMVDGVVYILRDGKLFNLQGTQVR